MSRPLLSLAPSDLRALAGAIRSGRLIAPYSVLAVTELVNREHSAAITASLQRFADSGASASALAQTLDLLAEALSQRPKVEELIQVVVTGPQVGGSGSRDTSVVVRDLFQKAERSVLVAGYSVYQGQKVFQALAARMAEWPELKVRMYLDVPRKPGDTTIENELVKRFCNGFKKTEWPADSRLPEIFYDPRSAALDRSQAAALHAKCVVVDKRDVFISSANFTEAAQTKNIELGLLVSSPVIAGHITEFFEQLVQASRLLRAL